MKMKLRQNVIHSVSGSGYCETSKVERALTLDGGTSPLPYSPQSPQRSPTYIQNTFKSEMKNISAESPVKPRGHRLNYSWSDCSWVFNLCFGTYLDYFSTSLLNGSWPFRFPPQKMS